MAATVRNILLLVGVALLSITTIAAAIWYKEYSQFPQTRAWIYGQFLFEPVPGTIQVNADELARYPTLKAYIDYLEASPGIIPHGSRSIEPKEAKSLLVYMQWKAGESLKLSDYMGMSVIYGLKLEFSGHRYEIWIDFRDGQPILD